MILLVTPGFKEQLGKRAAALLVVKGFYPRQQLWPEKRTQERWQLEPSDEHGTGPLRAFETPNTGILGFQLWVPRSAHGVLILLQRRLRGSQARHQDCTATAQNGLVKAQDQLANCSGLETEVDFGEVKIRKGNRPCR
jgi:hypothetical protein